MKHEFKVGDHVEWNSEAGRVRGTIRKKVTSAVKFKTYTVRASKEEPQYLIKSDKTVHLAMHKGAALKKLKKSDRASQRQAAHPKNEVEGINMNKIQENSLRKLEHFGQSIWMDFIRRGTIVSGELKQLIEEEGLGGVTSNPSIFEKAIAESHDYDEAIRALALEGKSVDEIYAALTVEDIQRTADLFRPVYDRLNGADGFVSLEVSPYLAHDTAATIADARRLWAAVARPNAMIKVPATREGLPAIEQLIGEGININITLLFGLPRYRQVAEAYLAGLETRAAQGKPLISVASVASFFLSRIDVLLDPRLEELIATDKSKADLAGQLHGQVAILSAKAAYEIYRGIFASERFRKLKAQGARTQRLLWASTSTKNPAYNDLKYVEALIGPETVNTVPLETLAAYRDHGEPALRLANGAANASQTLRRLGEVGIDLDVTTQQLEDEGVKKFAQDSMC